MKGTDQTIVGKWVVVALATWLGGMAGGCQPDLQGGGSGAGLFAPRGEPWTIECLQLQGPGHREHTEAIAETLRRTTGIDGGKVTVRHEADASTICYGTYYRQIDRLTGERPIPEALRNDLALFKEQVDERGRRVFLGARMVPQPLPDVGNAEWDLRNADGAYTLQVAVFEPHKDVRNYKQAAFEYCRYLRQKGYDAYFYHTDANSIVTVGVFGNEALVDRDGQVRYEEVDGKVKQVFHRYSDEVLALQKKETFAYNLTNGQIWYAKIGNRKTPVPSVLVRIPREE